MGVVVEPSVSGSEGNTRLTSYGVFCSDFVNTLIAFPKTVVVAVNGPAVGFGMALLALCDVVYASDKASFCCPYTRLCQTPEACSSYTLPKILGSAMVSLACSVQVDESVTGFGPTSTVDNPHARVISARGGEGQRYPRCHHIEGFVQLRHSIQVRISNASSRLCVFQRS